MTYHEAIEAAKKSAKSWELNCIVYSYKRHWWLRKKYGYALAEWFPFIGCPAAVKLLTITPNGTISQ